METRKTPLVLTASALAMALMLVGCGGGSSSSTPQPTVAAATGNDNSDDDTTMQAPTPVTVAPFTVGAKYLDESDLALTDTTAAITIAANSTANVGPYVLTNSHATESATVTVKDGVITATGGTVTATGFVEKYADMIEAAMKMEMAEMTGRAAGQSKALEGGIRPTGTPASVAEVLGKVSHNAGKGVSASATGFKKAMEQPAALGKFTGVALVNMQSSAATQHMTVYTDRAAPKRAEFFEHDGSAVTTAIYVDTNTDDQITLVEGTPGPDEGKMSGANLDPTLFPQKPADATSGSVRMTFRVNTDTDTDGDNDIYRSTQKSFDGASGRYECTPATPANGCTITVSASGAYMKGVSGDVWTFIPSAKAMGHKEDSEFLTFGWWLNEPAKSTGAYDFYAFYNGTAYQSTAGETGNDIGKAVTGDATYTGNAAGQYVVGDNFGEFTADAMLKANFGVAAKLGSISGSITNFQGDADAMSGWSVELKTISLDHTPADGGSPNPYALDDPFMSRSTTVGSSSYDGTIAKIGDTMAHGAWQGSFYGNARNADGTLTENAAPLAVGGKFHADGTGVNIAGAFGARR